MGDHHDKVACWFRDGWQALGISKSGTYKALAAGRFPGPAGRESAGIVDLIAIRKDHGTNNNKFKRGDLFEIILIQIKGGGARLPKTNDIRRLRLEGSSRWMSIAARHTRVS
ncbi:MAG: hypothetical protein ACE5JU_23650 [Candidatus Binatia bacterium]